MKTCQKECHNRCNEDAEVASLLKQLVRKSSSQHDFRDQLTKHTRRHLKAEHRFPGPVVDRMNSARWREEGSQTLDQRARAEVDRLLASHQPSPISAEVETALVERMGAAARAQGLDSLPSREP